MDLIESLKWRYATKKFNTDKKVNRGDLEKIKEAVQLSASSYGLQLYKILIIEDPGLREKLKSASWGQPQITDASYLFIFCNYTVVKDEHIDEYIRLKANTQGVDPSDLKRYGDSIKGSLSSKSDGDLNAWTARQTYIALGNLLAACAELRVDACPMEGFKPEKYNEILGLTEKGLNAAVIATIGYRSSEDKTQYAKKVRKPFKTLFELI